MPTWTATSATRHMAPMEVYPDVPVKSGSESGAAPRVPRRSCEAKGRSEPMGLAGPLYGVAALALGGMFLVHAVRLWREDRDLLAMRTFRFSIIYLFALFAALALDRVVQDLLVG